jgi:hypothetical protein
MKFSAVLVRSASPLQGNILYEIARLISDDMEVLEVDTAKEVTIIPMKQIKYISCDATVFASKPKG